MSMPLAVRPLYLNFTCEVCGKKRSHGNHTACSKARQAKFNAERRATPAQGKDE